MSVTAYPVILVNSAAGSDSAASGAGPGTALTGTAASVAATATSVSITDAVNLSGVAVDGSACLYYADSTTGHRNFDQITAVSGSSGAWTVTVANGFSTSTGPFSWAIGGQRASIGSASSVKLLNNNSAAGDAMPGWTVQLQSGHSETIASTLTPKRSGNTTTGFITLQGQPGASVLPVLIFSNNGTALELSGGLSYFDVNNFALQNSNATKTSSVGISVDSGGVSMSRVFAIKIADPTNYFYRGIFIDYQDFVNPLLIEFCEVAYTAGDGIYGQNFPHWAANCYIHNCTGNGIYLNNYAVECTIQNNVIANNGGRGILFASAGLTAPGIVKILNNTIDGNQSSGMEWQSTDHFFIYSVSNNILSNNGGYGFNWISGSDALAKQFNVQFLNNNTYNNTSGPLNGITSAVWLNDPGLNPQYSNAASGNYGIGANLRNKGYPDSTLALGSYSSTYSYPDIGAAQHQDSGGGGPCGAAVFVDQYW